MFPAGTLALESGRTIGVIRIQGFDARLSALVCQRALAALAIGDDAPCDDAWDRISEDTWREYHAAYIRQVKALAALRPAALIVDLAGNGGGSEWAQVAGRVLTPVRMRSSTGGMIRHPHSAARLDRLAQRLEAVTPRNAADEAELARLKALVMAKREQVDQPCNAEPLWRGETLDCELIVRTDDLFPPRRRPGADAGSALGLHPVQPGGFRL